jgi:hypothetical protein
MKAGDREAEDVAGLFRKFGGDARVYKEFAPQSEAGLPAAEWARVSGPREGATEPAAAAPVTPVRPASPVTSAAATAPPAVTAHAPAQPAAVEPPAGHAVRELDVLFARLAGQPPPRPEIGHGLMARWRKTS